VLIVRDGAVGDLVMVTPAIRWWAQQGYRVDVACKPDIGAAVLANNPHVSQRIDFGGFPTMEIRKARIKELREESQYERVFDLAGSCEGRYLFHSTRPEYFWGASARRAIADGARYYETCCQWAGLPEGCDEWQRPEMFPSHIERERWASVKGKSLGSRWLLVQLCGSSINKAWPWWHEAIKRLQRFNRRLMVVLTGGEEASYLAAGIYESGADPRRTICAFAGPRWKLRDSLIATAFADCVVGPETGVINAAACFDTPKVPLLSHSTAENLCTGWRNCFPVQSPAPCSPCYRIVSGGDPDNHTETGTDLDYASLCMASISPETVVNRILEAIA